MVSLSVLAPLAALFALAAKVEGHGYPIKPQWRPPGPWMYEKCGDWAYLEAGPDLNAVWGTIEYPYGIDWIVQERGWQGLKPKDGCNMFQCRGHQIEDNTNIHQYEPGQVIDMEFRIRVPHQGAANISVIDISTNQVLKTLVNWQNGTYSPTPVPQDQLKLSVTLPDLPQCAEKGRCTIQWFWHGIQIGQFYEACLDYVQVPAGQGEKTNEDGTAPGGSPFYLTDALLTPNMHINGHWLPKWEVPSLAPPPPYKKDASGKWILAPAAVTPVNSSMPSTPDSDIKDIPVVTDSTSAPPTATTSAAAGSQSNATSAVTGSATTLAAEPTPSSGSGSGSGDNGASSGSSGSYSSSSAAGSSPSAAPSGQNSGSSGSGEAPSGGSDYSTPVSAPSGVLAADGSNSGSGSGSAPASSSSPRPACHRSKKRRSARRMH